MGYKTRAAAAFVLGALVAAGMDSTPSATASEQVTPARQAVQPKMDWSGDLNRTQPAERAVGVSSDGAPRRPQALEDTAALGDSDWLCGASGAGQRSYCTERN